MTETDRIWRMLERIDHKIDDICGRVLKVEINQRNHYKEIEKKQSNKDRRFYIIIAAMGVGFTIFQYVRELV